MKIFSMRRMGAIFSKEFKHIFRDPFTLLMALMLPLAIVLILGNSIEFNVKSINMAYHDADRTESSRKLMETFASLNQSFHSSILMVTHDAAAAAYAERILFLKDGKIFSETCRGSRTRRELYREIVSVNASLGGETDVI